MFTHDTERAYVVCVCIICVCVCVCMLWLCICLYDVAYMFKVNECLFVELFREILFHINENTLSGPTKTLSMHVRAHTPCPPQALLNGKQQKKNLSTFSRVCLCQWSVCVRLVLHPHMLGMQVNNQIFVVFPFFSHTQCFVLFLPSFIILKSTSNQFLVDLTEHTQSHIHTHACPVLIHSCCLTSHH